MSNKRRKTKQTTIYLDDVTKRRASIEANKLGLSFSGYLRYLINRGNEPNPQIEITIEEDGTKIYDLAEGGK